MYVIIPLYLRNIIVILIFVCAIKRLFSLKYRAINLHYIEIQRWLKLQEFFNRVVR